MRVAIVFAGIVMLVVLPKRSQAFQPMINVLDQSALVIVDVDPGGDMHGRHQHHSLLHSAFLDGLLHLRSDVNIRPVCAGMKL